MDTDVDVVLVCCGCWRVDGADIVGIADVVDGGVGVVVGVAVVEVGVADVAAGGVVMVSLLLLLCVVACCWWLGRCGRLVAGAWWLVVGGLFAGGWVLVAGGLQCIVGNRDTAGVG